MGKIDIKGDIVSNDVGEFYEWFGMSSTYPNKIQQAIANDEDDEIVLDVASNGGDVFAASEIYTMLKDSSKNIVVNIQGLAASAASVIAMAGNTVRMSPTSQLMIHKASVSTVGNSDDLEHESEVLNGIDESIAMAYELKTGMKQTDILQLMSNETWMNAKAAVDKGFADEIMFNESDDEPMFENAVHALPSKAAINKFKNLIAKEKLNKQQSQPKNSLREQKLAILLDKKGEN
ncbi:head maturation protease, ClpP-related [Streptococcus lutetiensis]|jgi:ATP-dependent Clp protease protease subunit|uniref:head maturation protease, ClpP-related n=1 Tax=Streptococcus lutetiensis TaxID=150055 RepID=UPI001BDB0684|nr:head maturation protease, ClpP-related [Streptococcus lutetiensis]MBT0944431.1 Clp protease ClpP [Streptococcus lutetiensis]MBT0949848.1 Clp protease ClpP [Streptococcus lutetiensis]DAU40663.1 MAG TPA: Putative ATP dependent Clp protease [Caudoviricetes sp.]DAW46522.1 MAG TPA: Putative ATP dependent Clp protease [Caudoviricetes sp.]